MTELTSRVETLETEKKQLQDKCVQYEAAHKQLLGEAGQKGEDLKGLKKEAEEHRANIAKLTEVRAGNEKAIKDLGTDRGFLTTSIEAKLKETTNALKETKEAAAALEKKAGSEQTRLEQSFRSMEKQAKDLGEENGKLREEIARLEEEEKAATKKGEEQADNVAYLNKTLTEAQVEGCTIAFDVDGAGEDH